MLEVKKQEKEKHLIELEVTVDTGKVSEELKAVYAELNRKMSIPGFRKGRAPRSIIKSRVGKEAILDYLAQRLVPWSLQEALKRESVEFIGEPEVEIVQIEEDQPAVFRFTLIEKPQVTLPDPESIEVKKYKIEIREQDIERELQRLRESRGKWVEKEEPVQAGDLVTFKVGENSYSVLAGEKEGLAQEVLGTKKGEQKTVTLEKENGDTVELDLEITGVLQKEIPEIDEAFLKEIGEFESLEALKAKIRESLEKLAQDLIEERMKREIIVELAKKSELHLPEPLIQLETRRQIDAFRKKLEQDNLTLEKYLELTNNDFASFEESMRKVAQWELRKFFVIQQYMEQNEIRAEEKEVEEKINDLARSADKEPQEVRAILERNDRIKNIEENIKFEKMLEQLKQKIKVKEIEEPINLDQWRALADPEEEMVL
ncbi:MAG: trigger factor [Candidatus Atribacteria bacterium]|nr:trigger factor [Candidatus Atribacteria bacterium]MCD6349798.1 trigger factor [Candidatus Atribacteria bacterium]